MSTSLVISAFNNFMAVSTAFIKPTISWGLIGSFDTIPDGYIVDTILLLSSGVNQAMEVHRETKLLLGCQ